MSKCLILSAAPVEDAEPLRAYLNDIAYIICADGGAALAEKLNVKPDVIIGDLDSVSKIPSGAEVLRFNAEKDDTDTMLAVKHGIEKGFNDFIILGATGGRPDHTFANLCVLLYIKSCGCEGFLADFGSETHIIVNESILIKKRVGYYVSVFPFGCEMVVVTLKGLKYPLTKYELRAEHPIGISNEFLSGDAEITAENGALIIYLVEKNHN